MNWLKFWKFKLAFLGLVVLSCMFFLEGTSSVFAKNEVDWYRSNRACWVTGLLGSEMTPGDSDVPSLYTNDNWGSVNEFVLSSADLGSDPRIPAGASFVPAFGSNYTPVLEGYRDGLGVRSNRNGSADFVFYRGGAPFTGDALGVYWEDGFPFTGQRNSKDYLNGVKAPPGVTVGMSATPPIVPVYSYNQQAYEDLKQNDLRSRLIDLSRKGGRTPLQQGEFFTMVADSLGRPVGFINRDEIRVNAVYPAPTPPTAGEVATDFRFAIPGLFRSFPEAVDYTFAADVLPTGPFGDLDMNDARMDYLEWLVSSDGISVFSSRPDRGFVLPWPDVRGYLERRAVAKAAHDRVEEYSALWLNPNNPGGGARDDLLLQSIEARAFHADLAVARESTLGGGSRNIYGRNDFAVNEVASTNTLDCVGTACNATTTTNVSPTVVPANVTLTDVNNRESETTSIVQGARNVRAQDNVGNRVDDVVLVDPRVFDESTLNARLDEDGSYGSLFILDSEADQVLVNIKVNPEHRRDYIFNAGEFVNDLVLPAFGFSDSVWTYDLLEPGIRAHGLNQFFEGPYRRGSDSFGPQENVGYRQPSLSRAYYCPGQHVDDFYNCFTGVSERDEHETNAYDPAHTGSDSLTDDNVAHIRWPVNLEDLNWYMYQLPGPSSRMMPGFSGSTRWAPGG